MWETLIPIIAQYGLPLAEKLFQKWSGGADPTQADFDELRAMAGQRASDQMRGTLTANGMDLASPLALQLLGLSGAQTVAGTPTLILQTPGGSTAIPASPAGNFSAVAAAAPAQTAPKPVIRPAPAVMPGPLSL